MDTKALKKQMGAAIAMVLVAAVALGSATFAWFVSNNTVEAKTTNISAQSNSAYLVIDDADAGKTNTDSTSSATASETFPTGTKLYPAQWKNTFDANGKKNGEEGFTTATYQFESAYAQSKDTTAEKNNTRFAIGNPEKAAELHYTLANKFFIGTGTYDGTFTDLKVTKVTVNNADSKLSSAMRVLVTCDGQWAVWSSTQMESSSNGGIIKAAGITKDADAEVMVYVYYDGADGEVFTTNLNNLTDCGVTVTFEATQKEFKSNQ